jgi:putative DNA primase/helicase
MSTEHDTASDGRPPRPTPLQVDYTGIPDALQGRDSWLLWRYQYESDRDEWTKVPIDPHTGNYGSATDSDTWGTFEHAQEAHDSSDINSDGIGFVFRSEDTVVGIDIDDARDSETGSPTDTATDIINRLDSFTEVSPSSTGYHGYGFGTLPPDAKNRDGKLEMYEEDRFFTVTGHRVDTTPTDVKERNDILQEIHADYIAEDDPTDSRSDAPSDPVDLSDQQLLEKAKNAEYGDEFQDLWGGNTRGYESHSEADYHLCRHLLFWTGGNRSRAERLFNQSGLSRDKWTTRKDYRNRTLEAADNSLSGYYDPEKGRDLSPEPSGLTDESGNPVDRESSLLTPWEFQAEAGLGEEDSINDLNDKQKAAVTWRLLKRSDKYHVRVHRETGTLWAYNQDTGVWKRDGERALQHATRKAVAPENYGANLLNEVKAQARADPSVEIGDDRLGVDAGTLVVANGLLDLQKAYRGDSDAIRPIDPKDYALSRLPVTYDPNATGGEWRDFVTEVVESEKLQAVQEYAGYTLHRGKMPFNRALLCVGSGANGKSTFLNVVRALLGEENTESKPVHRFGERFGIADLQGQVANIDADLSEGSLSKKGIANFKRLVGNDKVTAERKHKDPFSFTPSAKHLYACNQVPDVSNIVSDDDTAFWRRWIIVQFPRYIPPSERDPKLEERLTDDDSLSGVLNWAIEGWGRLMEQGGFTNVESTAETRALWQSWGDSADEFLTQCVESDPDATNITTNEAWQVYREWCRQEEKDPVGQRKFTNTAKGSDVNLGYGQSVRPRGTETPTNGYKHFGLTDDAPELSTVLEENDSTDESIGGRNTSLDEHGE